MVGRLNMNLAHDGSKLRVGGMVQLHLFTLLTYVTSSSGEQGDRLRVPMVVIHTFLRIGYTPLPQNVGNPMTCVQVTELCELTVGNEEEYKILVEVNCTPQQRYCAKYGLSPVMCVCDTDPPQKLIWKWYGNIVGLPPRMFLRWITGTNVICYIGGI
jgi:hypothetical protein